jgi:hypothetical protein
MHHRIAAPSLSAHCRTERATLALGTPLVASRVRDTGPGLIPGSPGGAARRSATRWTWAHPAAQPERLGSPALKDFVSWNWGTTYD